MIKPNFDSHKIPFLKITLFWLGSLFLFGSVHAQKNLSLQDGDRLLKEAKDLYQKELYSNAQVLFKRYLDQIDYFDASEHQLSIEDATLYYNICAFKLEQPHAVTQAEEYVRNSMSLANRQEMSYELGHHYFLQNDFSKAVEFYENMEPENLPEKVKDDAKFELAYSYFNVQSFNKAYPLFRSIRNRQNKYYVPSRYYAGYIALQNNQYDAALRDFEEVVDEPKYDQVVPYYIAEIYYHKGEFDRLLDYALPYIDEGSLYYDKDLRHLVGQTYFEKQDYEKALPYLSEYEQEAETLQKGDVYQLAYSYYQTGQLEEAISGFKQLSSGTDSLAQNSMYLLGDCYLKTGQKEEARQAFAFGARSPYNSKQQEVSKFNYGKLSYELGYQEAALKTLQDFLQDYPQSDYQIEARGILAELFMNTADYKNALAILEGQPKESDIIKRAYQRVSFGRAMQLINDNNLEEANQLLQASLNYNADQNITALAHFWLGEIAFRNKKYDDAIKHLQLYLSQDGNSLGEANSQTANYNLGYSYLEKGQYRSAISHFKEAQSAFGKNGSTIAKDALLREADSYYMLKEYDMASALYDRALRMQGAGNDYALYQKGIITGIGGNTQQKISILNQLADEHPESNYTGEADYQIGSTYMNDGEYDKAVPYFKKVIEAPSNPDKTKARLKLATAYTHLNQNEEAISQYKEVIQSNQNTEGAREAMNGLKNVYIETGQPSAYLDYLKSIGRTVNASAEDSLTYAAAEASFASDNYTKAIGLFGDYLSKFPNGEFTQKAHFYRAESANSNKDYTQALTDYEAVLEGGNGPFAERSAEQAASISFYETKDYEKALNHYKRLQQLSTSKENTLTARRGVLRSNYELKQWGEVRSAAQDLLELPGIGTGDQIVGHFYWGRAEHERHNYNEAIDQYKAVAEMTTSELGAESRYYIALALFQENRLDEAEEAAFEVIKETPSYDFWVAKSYILLGEVFWQGGDYFNAKATLQSIIDNSEDTNLVEDAQSLLKDVEEDEKQHSKITD